MAFPDYVPRNQFCKFGEFLKSEIPFHLPINNIGGPQASKFYGQNQMKDLPHCHPYLMSTITALITFFLIKLG